MGTFSVSIQVGNLEGGDMESVHEATVDTGAAHTMLPASLLEQLHVNVISLRSFSMADGNDVRYGVGIARIAIQGNPEEWPCPVILGPEDIYLLGATTLETFGLAVDPQEERLVPRPYRARPI